MKGTSGDTFGPLGPYLVTKDEIEDVNNLNLTLDVNGCLLYTSPSPRDGLLSRMPSSA